MTEKRFQKRYIGKNNKVYDTWKEMPITNELNSNSLLNVISHLNGLGEMIDVKIEQGRYCVRKYKELEEENEQLKSTTKKVIELLSEEVDVFSEKATEHDLNAYRELQQLDNKDAYYMATATKEAIKLLKGDME